MPLLLLCPVQFYITLESIPPYDLSWLNVVVQAQQPTIWNLVVYFLSSDRGYWGHHTSKVRRTACTDIADSYRNIWHENLPVLHFRKAKRNTDIDAMTIFFFQMHAMMLGTRTVLTHVLYHYLKSSLTKLVTCWLLVFVVPYCITCLLLFVCV